VDCTHEELALIEQRIVMARREEFRILDVVLVIDIFVEHAQR
jgi:hypothetical protein